jgi:hypothetical protein
MLKPRLRVEHEEAQRISDNFLDFMNKTMHYQNKSRQVNFEGIYSMMSTHSCCGNGWVP